MPKCIYLAGVNHRTKFGLYRPITIMRNVKCPASS